MLYIKTNNNNKVNIMLGSADLGGWPWRMTSEVSCHDDEIIQQIIKNNNHKIWSNIWLWSLQL